MTGKDLKTGREQKGWTQEESASRLGVSQPYLSLLEKGARRVPEKLARKASAHLVKRGVQLRMNTTLVSASAGEVMLSTGERLQTRTIIVTAGIVKRRFLATAKRKRMAVASHPEN